ncbi:AbgT family transporter [Cetobacterium sp. 2A]|uniref:AbgT family transporter n=1 Tax=Cetobacterium sp. 2A TaxID=2754723 RepID=UPI00163B6A36|nr:AbgT family transporter [Cetobacterium sp. 2A]MBC2855120.1 AbgT family transporter [Cetobacterium sp. 2A]
MAENIKVKNGNSFLDWIEKTGNKIPHPFILFFIFAVGIIIISTIANIFDVNVTDPVKNEIVKVKSLLSSDGINFMLQSMIKNFTGFSPLGLVLVMTLGIGLAEHVGLVSAFMRNSILNSSPKIITFMIMLIGICGNIASDAAIVIVPVISAIIFLSLGKHPLAGIAVGYAATTAGFSANLIVAGTDALLAGISTEAMKIVNPNVTVSVVSNWYFMAVSTFLLAIVGTIVTEKIIEPRLGKYTGNKTFKNEAISPVEKSALRWAGIYSLIYILFIVAIVVPKNSFLRNPKTGSLLNSPLLNSIIPLLLFLFLIAGITYGKRVGQIKTAGDIPRHITSAMKDMSSYIVLVFMIGQFIAYFNWSNLGFILAVNGADFLKNMNLKGIPLFLMFIILSSIVNLFIGSGSAKWALLAPIFIPMFYMLGYNPALTQMLYRIGDSTTNVISPLFPYMPIILGLAQEYDEDYGMGTVISVMMPYTIALLLMWSLMAIVWVYFGIPLGPGTPLYI